MSEFKTGLTYETKRIVADSDTAAQFGSGGIAVFATPMMVGIMENAAMNCVGPYLEEGQTTVGTHLDVKHLAATPVGMEVRARAELLEIDGRRLRFKVEAFDQKEKIGEGFHERFIINTDKFLKKIAEKAQSS
ncbi:thioesterase family protein [Spirochaeta isovalerica]|uniref:Putative thioesterase n=1 Tax=Spirochaeta isovalerica TaxID=150 RepID=A0A841RB50_9SPIO|nr:thioesterase family protein [Spirochaeta isovalerica]MBB6481185.1 putative thioesterase [Spirochaeta isovalerica]